MNKAAATYSDRRRRPQPKRAVKNRRPARRPIPRSATYGATILFALALCFTINFRAFTELSREMEQHESLNAQIENVTSENLNLQEEIYYLQNDADTIKREARKFGFKREEKKVPVPTNK